MYDCSWAGDAGHLMSYLCLLSPEHEKRCRQGSTPTRFLFKRATLILLDDFLHALLGILDQLGNFSHGFWVSHRVTNAYTEAMVGQPVVDNKLHFTNEGSTTLPAIFIEHNVNDATPSIPQSLLVHHARNKVAITDEDLAVCGREAGVVRVLTVKLACCAAAVADITQQQAEGLQKPHVPH
jgi:hypothetical protein